MSKKAAAVKMSGETMLSVSCRRSDLIRAVATLRQITGAKTYPITANVLIRSNETGGISVEATNLEVFGLVGIPGEVESGGAVTVDARRLGDFVRELPGGDVTIAGSENGFVEVRSGRSRAKLAGMPASDFPATPASDGAECRCVIDGDTLGGMIDRALFASAGDDVRPTLSGLLFEMSPASLGVAATDGHRLSYETATVECSGERRAVVPGAALRVVRKALTGDDVAVSISGSIAWFSCADWMIGARLIDGEFPDFSQVVPKSSALSVSVSREEFLASVRRVSVVTSDRARGIRLRVSDGTLELLAQSADYGEASESVACEVVSGAPAGDVAFNGTYLQGALDALGGADRVQVSLGAENAPALIEVPDLDWQHVLMPMRV